MRKPIWHSLTPRSSSASATSPKSPVSLTLHCMRSINQIASLLPGGFQRQEAVWARVRLDNEEFSLGVCGESSRKISSDIIVDGETAGTLEVGYLDRTPEAESGVFSTEERLLLYTVAKRIGGIIASHRAEEALRLSEEKFSKAFHASPNIVIITELESGRIIDINNSSTSLIGWPPQESNRPQLP